MVIQLHQLQLQIQSFKMKNIQYINKCIRTPVNQPLLQLENKSMPYIEVDDKNNTIKYTSKNDTDCAAARTSSPLSIIQSIAYFQVKIKDCQDKKKLITIGISHRQQQLHKPPGFTKNSIGFQSSGQLYYDKLKVTILEQYGKNDVIGCGVNYEKNEVFFTKNGRLIQKYIIKMTENLNEYYPTGSVQLQKQFIEFNFGISPFKFDIESYLNTFREQRSKNILSNGDLETGDIFQMIEDYLYFNGYMQTLKKVTDLRGKNLNESKKNYLLKDLDSNDMLGLEDNLELKVNTNQQFSIQKEDIIQQEIFEQQKTEKQEQMDFELPEKFELNSPVNKRYRIMSEAFDENIVLTRKFSTENKSLILKNMQSRKDSILSLGDYSLKEQNNSQVKSEIKNEQKQQEQNISTANRKFIQNQRIKIISLIKDFKLEEAMTLIKDSIPKLFLLSKNLEYYFLGHIYLRTIKQGQHIQAVYFARKNNLIQYESIPFLKCIPQKGITTPIPFSQLISTIRYKSDNSNCKILSKQQFVYFADYVNRQILKYMGIIEKCKLEIIFSQFKFVEDKFDKKKLKGDRFAIFE